MRTHYTSFITSTLHILHGGCVTRVSRIHCIYFIEHMWHIPTDVYTPHINHPLCGYTTYTPWCIHSICTMEDVSCIRGAAYAEQYYDPSWEPYTQSDFWQYLCLCHGEGAIVHYLHFLHSL